MNRAHLLTYSAFSRIAEVRHPSRGVSLENRALANWQAVPEYAGHCVFVYCATLGEFRAIGPLIDALQQARPDLRPVYILGDPQYAETLRTEAPEATIFALPGPLLSRVGELFARYRPALVIYTEGPALHGRFPQAIDLSMACQCLITHTPLIVANACLYETSLPSRIDRIEHALFKSLHNEAVAHWYCGHKVFADQLVDLGLPPQRISTTGDLKFDAAARLLAPPVSEHTARYVSMIRHDNLPTIVAGCINAVDEFEVVVDAWETVCANGVECRLIVAPRYLNNAPAMEKLFAFLAQRGHVPLLRSRTLDAPALAPLTLLDTFGELSHIYQAAKVAYAGRNHGVLEPLVAHVPTIVAADAKWRKDNSSYPLYHALASEGALWRLTADEPLANALMTLLENEKQRAAFRDRIASALAANAGAAERIVKDLRERGVI